MHRVCPTCPPVPGRGVTAALRHRRTGRVLPCESAGALVGGESRGYAYDFAQNLAKRTNSAGGSAVTASVNALNQLTSGLGYTSYTHDRRGNLLTVGVAGNGYAYAYNHENQCTTAGFYNGYNKSDFVYDGKGRLRKRTDYTWNGSSWNYTGETRSVYDGMLLVQERTSANHPAVTYTRGSDLSGSLEGAGGIGGLLARTVHSATTPYQPSAHACYHADGNGNVTYLLRQDRTHGGSYKYDPYGRLVASSGPLAAANTLRFSSSKQWHEHSASYYYGYRFYVPELQRWLNRDPIMELGGINLYGFVANNPVNAIDSSGLAIMPSMPYYPPAPRPPHQPAAPRGPGNPNGCGAAGDWRNPPDNFFFWNFGPACDKHDLCYGTCGAEKSKCDDEFLEDMLDQCRPYAFIPGLYLDCTSFARKYHSGVDWLGDGPFEEAQKKACCEQP